MQHVNFPVPVALAGVYRLWQPETELGTMATANLNTLSSFGEPFMDAVCKNACSGHDVARVSEWRNRPLYSEHTSVRVHWLGLIVVGCPLIRAFLYLE